MRFISRPTHGAAGHRPGAKGLRPSPVAFCLHCGVMRFYLTRLEIATCVITEITRMIYPKINYFRGKPLPLLVSSCAGRY